MERGFSKRNIAFFFFCSVSSKSGVIINITLNIVYGSYIIVGNSMDYDNTSSN